MIFLLVYDRPSGQLIDMRRYKLTERFKAEEKRLKIELDLNRQKLNYEVVLLEAETEEALRRTHRRYFENLGQIRNSTSSDAA